MAVTTETVRLRVEGAAQSEREVGRVDRALGGLTDQVKSAAAAVATVGTAMAAVRWAQEGAQIEAVRTAFARLGGTAEDVDRIVDGLGGTVDRLTVQRLANTARALGVSSEQFQGLTRVAQASAKALGRDMVTSLEDVVTGFSRGSAMILDNLGLQVRFGSAAEETAKKLGKQASELTSAERRASDYAEVLRAAAPLIDQVGAGAEGAAGSFAALSAAIKDATDDTKLWLAEIGRDAVATWVDLLGDAAVSLGVISDTTLRTLQRASDLGATARSRLSREARGSDEERAAAARVELAQENMRALAADLGLAGDALASAGAARMALVAQGEAAAIQTAEFRELVRLMSELPALQRAAADAAEEAAVNRETDAAAAAVLLDIERERTEQEQRRAKAATAARKAERREVESLEAVTARVRGMLLGPLPVTSADARAAEQQQATMMAAFRSGFGSGGGDDVDVRDVAMRRQQEAVDAGLAQVAAIDSQAAAWARLGTAVTEAGASLASGASVIMGVGLPAIGAFTRGLGDAVVASLFAGKAFDKVLGDSLITAGTQLLGLAVSGLAASAILAFFPGMQALAPGLATASAAGLGVAGGLIATGVSLGGEVKASLPSAGGAGGGARSIGADVERERAIRRGARGAGMDSAPQEIHIYLGGEQVDRQVHRSAARGARYDSTRRALAV